MQIKKTSTADTSVTLSFIAGEAELGPLKQAAVKRLGKDLKLAGFRPGKAPANIIEKNLDQALLQNEVLEQAVNSMYGQALDEHKLRPVARPEIAIKKFVPFTTLEFEATVDIIGTIKLPDYKKIKKTLPKVTVTAADITEVIDNIKTRAAERQEVQRAAKKGDEVTIDFKGVDAKGQPVNGADGKDYPLILGSDSFIPGFEDNVVGMKPGQEKTFTLTFPKDYGVAALANKKVTFTVTATKVQEIVEPKVDDAFAATVGPFKNLAELKDDIKKQLTAERERTAQRELEQSLLEEISTKTTVAIPDTLLTEQIEAMLREQRQNLVYRGQTFEEFLSQEGKTEDEYRTSLRPQAESRVKAGLALSEIADQEKLEVTLEELDARLAQLKAQYQDPKMQEELDKPENRRDIALRVLTEKTIDKLVGYATKQ